MIHSLKGLGVNTAVSLHISSVFTMLQLYILAVKSKHKLWLAESPLSKPISVWKTLNGFCHSEARASGFAALLCFRKCSVPTSSMIANKLAEVTIEFLQVKWQNRQIPIWLLPNQSYVVWERPTRKDCSCYWCSVCLWGAAAESIVLQHPRNTLGRKRTKQRYFSCVIFGAHCHSHTAWFTSLTAKIKTPNIHLGLTM